MTDKPVVLGRTYGVDPLSFNERALLNGLASLRPDRLSLVLDQLATLVTGGGDAPRAVLRLTSGSAPSRSPRSASTPSHTSSRSRAS